jgi:4-hydroxy-2-oxoheptanedioate aldolase
LRVILLDARQRLMTMVDAERRIDALPSLRRRLLGCETLYGLVIKPPAPALVEMCAAAGFDFAFIDGEHGTGDALQWEHHVRSGESFGMPSIVRVGSHHASEVLRALDVGAQGIIVPHVNTRAEAEAIVRAAHYSPIGRRGLLLPRGQGNTHFLPSKNIYLQRNVIL